MFAFHDEHGADVVLRHDSERGEHGVVGLHRVDPVAFGSQDVMSCVHRCPPPDQSIPKPQNRELERA